MALGRELPDDLVADVLRCLPPRSVAVSRCVCRSWRDLVDARRLLRADLLPRSVGGIFINYCTLYSPEFLARPTTGPSISGDFEFIPNFCKVTDHCNGLVLCTETSGDHDYVSNPATRQWARLPLPPEPYSRSEMRKKRFRQIKCLLYDPTVSAHYDVFLIHYSIDHDQMMMQCEGPVLSYYPLQVCVYSSETGCWEERWFAPEGRVAETTLFIADKKLYWRGALYILCEGGEADFIMRISIPNAKYTLIPTPDVEFTGYEGFLLGRSEKGIYCAYDYHRLQIFLLNESCGEIVWELRHSVDLRTFARKGYSDQPKGPWILQDINHYKYPEGNDKHKEVVDDNFEWNSDDDNVLSIEDIGEGHYSESPSLLGFHPYKEIVFLDADMWRAVAYHWNTSKFQDLGNIYPKDDLACAGHAAGIVASFIYTPCWMKDFPKKKMSVCANCRSAQCEHAAGGIC